MDVSTALRDAGMRVTAPRLAVYEAVAAAPHSDTEQVLAGVRARLGTASTQGVYDALRALTALGLLRRIEPAGSPARYETRTGDNHHHAVCRACGTTADVDCATGATPCLTASDPSGFVVEEAEVTYWGTCPDCQTGLPPARSSA